MAKLHVELVKLHEWVKQKGLKVCIVFEGRDGAGKGGTIKAIGVGAVVYVVKSDDKKRARLNVIAHPLGRIPYKKAVRDKVKLPKRQKAHSYREPDYPFKLIPEKF